MARRYVRKRTLQQASEGVSRAQRLVDIAQGRLSTTKANTHGDGSFSNRLGNQALDGLVGEIERIQPMVRELLADLLAPNLKLIIVGTAAGNKSAERQTYYAGSGNRFWKTLHQVRLTPRELAPQEYRLLLDYGIGLTDLVKGKSGMDRVLDDDDFDRDELDAKIRLYRPEIVCLHGKKAAQAYFECRTIDYGLQQSSRIEGTRFFVVPQTSGANGHWNRLVGWWVKLAELVGGSI